MGYEFSQEDRADVNATIDEVWTAIATGPGIDSWFMGKNEVADGVVRLVFGALCLANLGVPALFLASPTARTPTLTAGSSPSTS